MEKHDCPYELMSNACSRAKLSGEQFTIIQDCLQKILDDKLYCTCELEKKGIGETK